MQPPCIIILSSVLSFIEEEVSKVDYSLETGGLLLGTKLPRGRLITHATPPGPNAIHKPSMFERDLDFSQAAIDRFARENGVDYVGEWHKHPPSLIKPSEADRFGVIEILKDPDYKTGNLMIFPIWVLSRNSDLRQLPFHHALVECFFWPTAENIHCYPYYMDNSFRFSPFQFEIASCNLGTQDKVIQFYEDYTNSKKNAASQNLHPCQIQNAAAAVPLSEFNSVNEDIYTSTSDSEGADTSTENLKQNIKHDNDTDTLDKYMWQELHWYESQKGRERLILEKQKIKSLNSHDWLKMLPTGILAWRFASPFYKHVYLDVVCKHNHPDYFPELYLIHKNEIKNIVDEQYSRLIMNCSVYVKTEVEKLKLEWESGKTSLFIADIADALGFADKKKK